MILKHANQIHAHVLLLLNDGIVDVQYLSSLNSRVFKELAGIKSSLNQISLQQHSLPNFNCRERNGS